MKLIALGDNCIDYYRNTGEAFPGGNAVNVAVHAAHQGIDASYLGAFGTDKWSEIVLDALKEHHVGHDMCPVIPGKTTKLCCYDVVNGERSFIEVVTGDSWIGPIVLEEAHLQFLSQADVIISSCNAKLPEQLDKVEKLPAVFVFDFGEKDKYRTDEYYDLVCRDMDLAMFSCEPMTEAAFAAFSARLHSRGVRYVLATMGSHGQMLSDGQQILCKTIQKIDAADTMGAGDAFLAAFVCELMSRGWKKHGLLARTDLEAAMEKGQQVSAENCMQQGGFGTRAN